MAAEIPGDPKRFVPKPEASSNPGAGLSANVDVPLTGVEARVNAPIQKGARDASSASKTLNVNVVEGNHDILSESDRADTGDEDRRPDFSDTQDHDFADLTPGTPIRQGSEAPDSFNSTGTVSGATDGAQTSTARPGHGTFEVGQDAAQAETVALKDALNRSLLAKVLAQLLLERDDKHPISLGLWGPWGVGKSSFVEFLKAELKASTTTRFMFAKFNAWKNERVENIGAALAQRVVEALVRELGFWQQTRLALKLAMLRNARHRKAILKDASRAWLWLTTKWVAISTYVVPFLGPLVVGSVALILFVVNKPVWGSLGTLGTVVSAWFSVHSVRSKQLLNWFNDLLKDHRSALRLPDYSEKIGSFHEMSRTLEDLCSLTLAQKDGALHADYLLVVIDDLDRCSPAAIKQVFDAVRLVASTPQVVVLLALDHRIAYAAVTKHYSEYGTADRELSQLARDYLAKVFNLSVTLAPAESSSIEKYIRHRLFDLPEETPKIGQPRGFGFDAGQSLGKSTAAEADAFCEFALSLQLTNPRELWRLRQAWSLLKGLVLPSRASNDDVRQWMRHLFLREAIAQGTGEQRKQAEQFLRAKPGEVRTELWAGIPTTVALSVLEGFDERDALVCAVLLPAAPPELGKTAAADAGRKA